LQSLDNLRSTEADAIDFNKLLVIIRSNWIWIALVFVSINAAAYLITRYTKNLYESTSSIKLDIKKEATEFGLKSVLDDPDLNIVSGEIEIIQSDVFLNQVVDKSHDFDVAFVSVGRVLNDEFFKNGPASIHVLSKEHPYYNVPITFSEIDNQSFKLKIGIDGPEMDGNYGSRVSINGLELLLERNHNFKKGDEVGYYFTIQSRDALLGYLSANLSVEPLNLNANTIRIGFKDHNPAKAQAVLNKIDTIYLEYSNEQKNLANKQKINWLANELNQIEARMEDYENYFERFMLKNKTNNLENDLERTILNLNRVDSQRYEIARRLREIDRLSSSLNSDGLNIPYSLLSSLPPVVNENINTIIKLQADKQKLAQSHSEITFAFQGKKNELDAVKSKTSALLVDIRENWQKKLRDLNKMKDALEKEFASFPDKNTEFTKNQRFYKIYEEFYLTLMKSKSEFEIAQAGTIPDFKILSSAVLPKQPISPNRIMILGIGLVASIIVNFFLIGILYLVDNKITSANELEKIHSASLLGSIPISRYPSSGIYVIDHPKSMVTEAMRSLRTNLDFLTSTANEKVIAISSTVSGEGKSFIAMNLGGIIALSNKRVVLIDLDMRKPKSEQPFAADRTRGVSTILIRKHAWTDCVVKTPVDSFDVIPSGPHPPNPSELLLTADFTNLIATLKQHYDFIILDTPPVGLVTDGIMAMRAADASIYVFRANYSKKDFLINLKRLITSNKFTNVTTILNAMPSTGKTYGYGYYEESVRKNRLLSFIKR
jgi:tyrosine-protein kinase Etk/Wzc